LRLPLLVIPVDDEHLEPLLFVAMKRAAIHTRS
jgi:hypothetical protein